MEQVQKSMPGTQDSSEKSLQPLSRLLRASPLEQIVGAQHHDQQVSVIWEGRNDRRDLPAVLSHVADSPAGFRRQDVHPPAVPLIASAEIASRVIAIGVGIAKADDLHRSFPFLCITKPPIIVFQLFIANPLDFPLFLPSQLLPHGLVHLDHAQGLGMVEHLHILKTREGGKDISLGLSIGIRYDTDFHVSVTSTEDSDSLL